MVLVGRVLWVVAVPMCTAEGRPCLFATLLGHLRMIAGWLTNNLAPLLLAMTDHYYTA
jgi:hypothetical protein